MTLSRDAGQVELYEMSGTRARVRIPATRAESWSSPVEQMCLPHAVRGEVIDVGHERGCWPGGTKLAREGRGPKAACDTMALVRYQASRPLVISWQAPMTRTVAWAPSNPMARSVQPAASIVSTPARATFSVVAAAAPI
ncbi:hypothetical protein GCM10009610_64170 [Pseudonocardia xinjiangensis]